MSKVCALCGKGTVSGNSVSHSNRRTRRKWLPNLQKMTFNLGGTSKSLKVCTKCRKTLTRKAA